MTEINALQTGANNRSSQAQEGMKPLIDKYGKDNPKAQRYSKILGELQKELQEHPERKASITLELKKLDEELVDALTRGLHMRRLKRRNRLVTDTEHKEVLAERAKTKERYKNKWEKNISLEIRYRLVCSGQGANSTIQNSAQELFDNVILLKHVLVWVQSSDTTEEADAVKSFTQQIDQQLRRNDNELKENTKETLNKLKSELERLVGY